MREPAGWFGSKIARQFFLQEGRFFMQYFLTVLRVEGEEIPDDINGVINGWNDTYTLIEKAALRRFYTALPELISNGAHVTFRVFDAIKYHPDVVLTVLETGADPNVTDKRGNTPFFVLSHCYQSFVHFMDYGGITLSKQWPYAMLGPDQYSYLELIRSRESNCRRALVALVGYCRRSKYTGLRPVYVELAKQIWRQRGPAGCGPRAHVWKAKE
jgi:hypothetical protein